ncbi:2'-5' RNA ligase family protein [Rufibacter sediminis]|uniref:Mutarotase n=1 Tax=Rufibacter sediminis TaxID=2762756 RepID=A0ABR6VU10_9BACT|nr:mutarotase [Rufibacter sediminis]MBC3540691.1 mutarotase [Rufibacter sediminis]
MNLQDHYTQLWKQSEKEFAAGNYELDRLLGSPQDTRRGLTLVARPTPAVIQEIQNLLRDLASLEPEQYYYPASDLHLTVLSIINGYPGFSLDLIHLPSYLLLVQQALENIPPLQISFSGITASTSCVLVQGFPKNDSLEQLRQNLRDIFRRSGLQQTIDQRYTIATAHSTVVRFRKPLKKPERFLQQLRECRKREFGTSVISSLELTCNDWYQRQGVSQKLATFPLT